jgi:hypothetical protein
VKVYLQTIGAIAIIIVFVIIGYTILSILMETNTTQSPEQLTSTKTPTTSVSPTTPAPAHTSEPEPISTSSKDLLTLSGIMPGHIEVNGVGR